MYEVFIITPLATASRQCIIYYNIILAVVVTNTIEMNHFI